MNREDWRELRKDVFEYIGGKKLTNELEVGQKYLTIQMVGHERVTAFPNRNKVEGDRQPDFKADGIAVWVNVKKEKPKEYKSPL